MKKIIIISIHILTFWFISSLVIQLYLDKSYITPLFGLINIFIITPLIVLLLISIIETIKSFRINYETIISIIYFILTTFFVILYLFNKNEENKYLLILLININFINIMLSRIIYFIENKIHRNEAHF